MSKIDNWLNAPTDLRKREAREGLFTLAFGIVAAGLMIGFIALLAHSAIFLWSVIAIGVIGCLFFLIKWLIWVFKEDDDQRVPDVPTAYPARVRAARNKQREPTVVEEKSIR